MEYAKTRCLYETEINFEWRKWMREIPYLRFPESWLVKAVPPWSTGIIRYFIKTEKTCDQNVSVYLDCYDQAGCMGQPYWEIYPIGGDVERFMMNETKELIEGIGRALAEIEQSEKGCVSGDKSSPE